MHFVHLQLEVSNQKAPACDMLCQWQSACAWWPLEVRLVTKKPVRASAQEAESNPRSRSAKLRVVEKL